VTQGTIAPKELRSKTQRLLLILPLMYTDPVQLVLTASRAQLWALYVHLALTEHLHWAQLYLGRQDARIAVLEDTARHPETRLRLEMVHVLPDTIA
jgi:hypothetical protein